VALVLVGIAIGLDPLLERTEIPLWGIGRQYREPSGSRCTRDPSTTPSRVTRDDRTVPPGVNDVARRISSWLLRPLSTPWCVIGWCLATLLFVGLIALLGGPASNDSYETVFSTWAVQHGQLACAFPLGDKVTAPLYPLVSGGIAAMEQIGHGVPFPSRGALGPDCHQAFLAINTWSLRADAENATIRIGYLSWFVLMAGVVAVLRSIGRGRCGWEPTTLAIVGCLPPVWLCVEGTFHPEDLVAMGLALAAVALARRSSWAWAGVVVALAVLSQQFALLVAAPLFVLAPPGRRLAYTGAAAGTAVAAVLPLSAVSSGDAAHAVLLGTGTTGGVGGTLLWELDLHGTALVALSRFAPILLSLLLAWWVVRRLGPASLEPVALLALVGLSLSFRLTFEQQLFGYYFMALSVALVLLDVAGGRFRATLVGWLATVSMVYLVGSTALDPLRRPGPGVINDLLPLSVMALGVLLFAREIRRGAHWWMVACWSAMIVGALVVWKQSDIVGQPPTWLWQLVLVPLGIALAATPLLGELRRHRAPASTGTRPQPSSLWGSSGSMA
jgi:Glycosyltransferase family 87